MMATMIDDKTIVLETILRLRKEADQTDVASCRLELERRAADVKQAEADLSALNEVKAYPDEVRGARDKLDLARRRLEPRQRELAAAEERQLSNNRPVTVKDIRTALADSMSPARVDALSRRLIAEGHLSISGHYFNGLPALRDPFDSSTFQAVVPPPAWADGARQAVEVALAGLFGESDVVDILELQRVAGWDSHQVCQALRWLDAEGRIELVPAYVYPTTEHLYHSGILRQDKARLTHICKTKTPLQKAVEAFEALTEHEKIQFSKQIGS